MKQFLFVVLFCSQAYSFEKPNLVQCSNRSTIKVTSNGKNQLHYKKSFSSLISEAAVIEFNVNKKAVAKLYPQDGLDFVLLDKNYSIQTDNKTFLKVNSKSKETLFSCELKYE